MKIMAILKDIKPRWALIVFLIYCIIGLLDCIPAPNGYSEKLTCLDIVLSPYRVISETTYTEPSFPKHPLGTDKVGRDVLYSALKSIRTGLIIGILTSLMMLPFAVFFGLCAGYFRGWIDDIIQYVYTTLSSVPAVLLIAAMMLSLQYKIEQNADLRLFVLCAVLGLTSWTTLCRLIRAETLKLREAEFVQSAIVLGVGRLTILWRHILPNLRHIIIIVMVLDFSGLVLAEAVLTYVGVGVDLSTYSFGNMINASRLELAREPMVWWPLLGAFGFMFMLVLSANLLSDAVQKQLDPRAR